MPKNLRKYCLRTFSLALLLSFLISNVSICALMISGFETQTMKCCSVMSSCDHSDQAKIKKVCCCEVREETKQPAEIPITFNEAKQKLYSYILSSNPTGSFDIIETTKSNIRVLSTHSPPKEDIYILNSNFRI